MDERRPGRGPRMDWLPQATDFRALLRTALQTPAAERLERLAALAAHRLGVLEIHQVDRALAAPDLAVGAGWTRLRVALLGSATLKHLAPAIRVAGLRHRFLFEVMVGEFGQFRHEAIDRSSALHRFEPAVVLLSVTARDLLGEPPLGLGAHEVDALLARAVDELRGVWRALGTEVIQQTFIEPGPSMFGSLDRSVSAAPARLVDELNARVTLAAAEQHVALLDLAGCVRREGLAAWFDVRYWLQAKQEVSIEAAAMYGELLARVVGARHGRSRKCLVLDLDNTLWGGIVGEVGIEGIVLGPGSADGEAHLALQHYAKRLAERGVVLAVCSKNELKTAEAVFREHPEMLLRRADIAAFVANWEDKADNLQGIVKALNIGLDSLVFVDDNPAERLRVREALPMVAVPELPEDPAHFVATLAAAGYFEAASFTREDSQRGAFYARNAERTAQLDSAASLGDFLCDLQMRVVHGPFAPHDLLRVTQLANKTNQFNTTLRRYSAEEVAARAAAPECITLQFRLIDRLGDNGIVSTMVLVPARNEPSAYELENWVMSCRVFGRELEFEAMNIAVESLQRIEGRWLFADYVPSPRNGIVAELFPRLGFQRAGGKGDTTRWRLEVANYLPHRSAISRELQT